MNFLHNFFDREEYFLLRLLKGSYLHQINNVKLILDDDMIKIIESYEDDKLFMVFKNINNDHLNRIFKRFCDRNKKKSRYLQFI